MPRHQTHYEISLTRVFDNEQTVEVKARIQRRLPENIRANIIRAMHQAKEMIAEQIEVEEDGHDLGG